MISILHGSACASFLIQFGDLNATRDRSAISKTLSIGSMQIKGSKFSTTETNFCLTFSRPTLAAVMSYFKISSTDEELSVSGPFEQVSAASMDRDPWVRHQSRVIGSPRGKARVLSRDGLRPISSVQEECLILKRDWCGLVM